MRSNKFAVTRVSCMTHSIQSVLLFSTSLHVSLIFNLTVFHFSFFSHQFIQAHLLFQFSSLDPDPCQPIPRVHRVSPSPGCTSLPCHGPNSTYRHHISLHTGLLLQTDLQHNPSSSPQFIYFSSHSLLVCLHSSSFFTAKQHFNLQLEDFTTNIQ